MVVAGDYQHAAMARCARRVGVFEDVSAAIDTGHFALETHGQEIADLMRDFLSRQLPSAMAAN